MSQPAIATKEYLVPVKGAELRVVEQGAGVPVFVPCGAGIEFYRNTFSARLPQNMRFIYVEMRGTGGSTGAIAGSTFASLADDVDDVRAALGLNRAIVLGHSNHGCIAVEYALRHPAQCLAAISACSSPDFSRAFAFGQQRWQKEASAEAQADLARRYAEFEAMDKSKMSADEVSIRQYIAMAPLGWHDPTFDVSKVWGGMPRGAADYMRLIIFEHGSTWNIVPRLPEIKVPLLAASGRYDYLCPVELWAESIDRVPDGRLEIFESSAHNPQVEERERFDSVILDFVRAHSA
ncbi:MAG TPA: alpha/beta hydrolase [Candidatus Acidoferrales bacterium]|nr:alpha/beta hydrolase [Candidatus Acidoferrales bacterium]